MVAPLLQRRAVALVLESASILGAFPSLTLPLAALPKR